MPRHSVRITLYRHSYALYGPFKPDLSSDGYALAEKTALEIAAEVDSSRPIKIVSSPKPRALGTADCVCRALGIPIEEIQQETDLSDYLVHNLEERNRILSASSPDRDFHRGWDVPYYAGDPLHDAHPDLFETRKSVAHRAFRWLGKQFQEYHDGQLHADIIAISHVEVLSLFVRRFAANYSHDPIRQCEALQLELRSSKRIGFVDVRASFRSATFNGEFRTPAAEFSRQFGNWI